MEELNNVIFTFGISDADLVNGLSEVPDKILLIDNSVEGNRVNTHTHFQMVVGQNDVRNFLLDRQLRPKKWLDFQDLDDVDLLMPTEIAELLYLSHMETHLNLPFYAKLQNRYACLDIHDNFKKSYFHRLKDFSHILDISMKRHLRSMHSKRWTMFNRPLAVNDLSDEIINQLQPLFREGVIFAFDQVVERKRQYLIPVFAELKPEQQPTWHEQEDVFRYTERVATLIYVITEHRWKLNIERKEAFDVLGEL
ncbi:hypothetical protein FD44_GL000237 [Secundilactobacillus malefermentans DSM 5705 = KCTC 3548]|nr:hypothetical protein [Secundilactobacillus malefermentans]KRM58949.1 hypothetical protein FD44_GL000237 [Secundilactobacillus malefermentans DSM 5705 = KCTC 3548]